MTQRRRTGPFRRLAYTMILLAFAVALGACGQSSAFSGAEGKLKVTATIGMITDIVRNVGGEHTEVVGLMKSGVDPHLYKATKGDIDKLTEADIVFYNGLHLEGKMVTILEKLNNKKPTVAVSRDIDRAKLRDWDGGGSSNAGQYDPHIWFDVRNWISATGVVRDELSKLDPDHAQEYKQRAEAYIAKLEQLHEETKQKIASIPEESRYLVTAHDAFGYFGDAYHIEVMGLQGISTATEAGLKDVSSLRDFLVDHQIKAVFVESSVPKKTIQAVVNGAKEKGHTIDIGGELYSDAMGAEGTEEGTYIGMVRFNVNTIVNALK